MNIEISNSEQVLLKSIKTLIEKSKSQVLKQANSALTMLFWQIGHHCNHFILEQQRATYGKQIIATLSRQLEEQYGRNFEEKNMRRMLQFADTFTDFEIVVTLSRQLS